MISAERGRLLRVGAALPHGDLDGESGLVVRKDCRLHPASAALSARVVLLLPSSRLSYRTRSHHQVRLPHRLAHLLHDTPNNRRA
ncbi:hypothetical protein PFISCL1PPCAC_21117 [Pristionchus fissidentatus]|uniref:Cyclic nucleotide-binding domain-containing protein n=1 Tax=Pristionchus fissidentatus TaxID=1538716 RepID=A0AAV5WH49_9BILA|nr:hypothetical protein PFISCL1PPCAC_21117 [Pristionchus fissidentatus]